MMGDVTLTEFLLARLDETEAMAMRSPQFGTEPQMVSFCSPETTPMLYVPPAHVLAWCAALRAVVERVEWLERADAGVRWEMELVARHLAAIWASHEAYDERWKP